MPNGCFSNNLFLGQSQNDSPTNQSLLPDGNSSANANNSTNLDMGMSSSSNDYNGYQMPYLNSSKLTSNFR
jgi:hypothetical protein